MARTMDGRRQVRSIEEEIVWARIEQFHAAVLQISRNCFVLKQICTALLVGILTLLYGLDDELSEAFFVAGVAIPLGFWFLDAMSYFYQEKLRMRINDSFYEIRRRSAQTQVLGRHGDVIELERSAEKRHLRSVFNHSMWLYPLLIIASGILWVMYSLELIR